MKVVEKIVLWDVWNNSRVRFCLKQSYNLEEKVNQIFLFLELERRRAFEESVNEIFIAGNDKLVRPETKKKCPSNIFLSRNIIFSFSARQIKHRWTILNKYELFYSNRPSNNKLFPTVCFILITTCFYTFISQSSFTLQSVFSSFL